MVKFFHNQSSSNKQDLPILNKLILTYGYWQQLIIHFPKTSRYSIGIKMDLLFIEVIELIYLAITLNKQVKLPLLIKANRKLDLIKFFMQVSWHIKAIDNKKYILASSNLEEIGKMLGGWIRQLKKTPA